MTKVESPIEPQPEKLELIKSGKLLYWPDLTDPNTLDPNEYVLRETGQPSGLVDSVKFFQNLTPETMAHYAPPKATEAFARLKSQIASSPDTPAAVFLAKSNYLDFLTFTVFMSTGKMMTENDATNQIKTTKALNLSPADCLVTLPAAIIGFSVTEKSGGKDGINSLKNFQLFVKKLASGDFKGTFSPLCAQYGSQTQVDGTIFAYKLLDHVATEHASRSMRWQNMLTLVHQLKHGSITQLWSTIGGDEDHIYSIVPKVIRQYAEENQLAKMFLLIDRHLSEFQQLSDNLQSGFSITALNEIEKETELKLTFLFGSDWPKITKSDMEQYLYRLEQNESSLNMDQSLALQIARIAIHDAFPGISRFAGQHQQTARLFEAKAANLDDDLANLNHEELQEWFSYRDFKSIEQAQQFLALIREKLISQGEIGPAADSLHEVMLYFTMGQYAANQNLLVIGLDIDHDHWMSTSWQYGYNYTQGLPQSKPVPILYARNPNTGKTDPKNVGKSFAHVYYTEKQGWPHQPLSNIALREYFCLSNSIM